MHNLYVVESRGQRVLTSAQIADCYDTTVDCIKQNFYANRNRFIEGKHYIALTGTELKAFKNEVRIPYQDEKQEENEVRIPHPAEMKARYQFNSQFKYAKSLYLWTEKGALLHAKSLNTDKAWQVYDYLVDFYFRAKEEVQKPVTQEIVLKGALTGKKKNAGQIPHMDNPLAVLHVLLQVAEEEGIEVRSFPFQNIDSVLKGKCIGIRQQLSMEKVTYELAWELAHLFIHYDAGNIIESPLAKEYNDQATRAAGMIIRMLNRQVSGS